MFRRALLIDPNDAYIMAALAQVLYFEQREEKIKQVFFSPEERRSVSLDLTEALELAGAAVRLLEGKENRRELCDALAGS